MPKMKTHRGASKRFQVTGKGRFARRKAFHSHLLLGKSPKRKRHLRQGTLVSKAEHDRVARMLPYA